jgi:hypothetical protein
VAHGLTVSRCVTIGPLTGVCKSSESVQVRSLSRVFASRRSRDFSLVWPFGKELVAGIEAALSAWKTMRACVTLPVVLRGTAHSCPPVTFVDRCL